MGASQSNALSAGEAPRIDAESRVQKVHAFISGLFSARVRIMHYRLTSHSRR